jgi:hypothetical protein
MREYYTRHRGRIKAANREYQRKHRAELAVKRREYRQTHKSEIAARGLAWSRANPQKRRAQALKSLFGLTIKEWESLFVSQGRSCGICGAIESGSKKGWATDHDHKTGKVRAILCSPCNLRLGFIEKPGVERFMEYLSIWKPDDQEIDSTTGDESSRPSPAPASPPGSITSPSSTPEAGGKSTV